MPLRYFAATAFDDYACCRYADFSPQRNITRAQDRQADIYIITLHTRPSLLNVYSVTRVPECYGVYATQTGALEMRRGVIAR